MNTVFVFCWPSGVLNIDLNLTETRFEQILDGVEEKAHPPVPIAEYAYYVNELKANDKEEFEKEYNVSSGYYRELENHP